MSQAFPVGSTRRSVALGGLLFAALLLFTQLVLPGGPARQGTPTGILFLGVVLGLVNALTAAGLILIYRTSRMINFAQAAIGGVGGVFAYNMMVAHNVNFAIAFAAGVVVAALVGLLVELVFVRRFFFAPRLVLTVITVALWAALAQAAIWVAQLPIWGDARDRDLQDRFGLAPITLPFEDFRFQIGTLPLEFGFAHLLAIAGSLAALGALALFLLRTRPGVAVRAAAQNLERASLLGIPVMALSTLVWTLGGALSGVGAILYGSITSFTVVGAGAPALLLKALAAAIIGRMRSIPVAVAAAVGIEIFTQALSFSFQRHRELVEVGLFFLVAGALLAQRRELQRSEEADTATWKATEEIRPVPLELARLPVIRNWRRLLIATGVLFLLGFPWLATIGAIHTAGVIVLSTIVLLSLVVLTGWAGQVSLGQFGFVAIGAVVGGALTAKAGLSFWLAVPAATLLTALFALLVGLPALRIRGLFLAVTTYAFGFAVHAALFKEEWFGWLLPDAVSRPTMVLVDFSDERSMYYLTLVALFGSIAVVGALRRSRPGRVLIGLRENESNLQSFGINLLRTRVAAFVLSGALAGFAGALLAHHQRAVTAPAFTAARSLEIFIFAVIGGVGSVSGAVIGGIYFGITRLVPAVSGAGAVVALLTGPVGLLIILYMAPGGLSQIVYGIRDSILRIIAQRRQIVVPSLFADQDPAALERKLAPLAPPIPNAGLATVPPSKRYRGSSGLYARHGVVQDRDRRAPDDRQAMGAAAERFSGEETEP